MSTDKVQVAVRVRPVNKRGKVYEPENQRFIFRSLFLVFHSREQVRLIKVMDSYIIFYARLMTCHMLTVTRFTEITEITAEITEITIQNNKI